VGRFYNLQVGNSVWSSQLGGVDNPGALDIEFDFFEYLYGSADAGGDSGASTLTLHGVALTDLQQAQNFVGRNISLAAGMSAGYPLANPKQAGLVLQGTVFQSFGNWVGTEQTLDFVVVPSGFTQANPGNFVLNWQPGTSLQDALTQTFSAAYAKTTPQPKPVFQLSGVYAPIATGHITRYSTLRNLAAAINSMTKAASPGGTGIYIGFVLATNSILVFDGAQLSTAPIQIAFTDFVGQPTWIDANVMQFTTVLRADIVIGSTVKMPQGLQDAPGIVTTTAASFPAQQKYKTSFQGTFFVKSVRQIGAFRDPNGASWVTVVQCVPQGTSS
jgi:hypothetical protein